MKNMTMGKIAAACKGQLYLPGKEQPCSQEEGDFYRNGEEIKSVTIDSRKVEQGSLFIATRGERVDGHSFIPSAISSGAMGICVRKSRKNVRYRISWWRTPLRPCGLLQNITEASYPLR